jgi:hypothetical protein
VLAALGAGHVTSGLFVLDKKLERTADGLVVEASIMPRLEGAIAELVEAARRAPAREGAGPVERG